jgi:two-component system cell cycle response regulator DivK
MRYYFEQDYDFHHIADGQFVIQFLLENMIDIVIMDINLGRDDIDGFKILKEIRNHELLRQLKVFALSGYSDSYGSSANNEKGFDLFFTKPIDFQHLGDAIKSSLTQGS